MTVLERFYAGDIRALSRTISFVENRQEGYREVLGRLYEKSGRSLRIGVTGPPGAGKSTIVNALIHQFLSDKHKIGVIAVDPTSPFTGGALLGDRIRMNEFPIDGSVYFRSMATRGATGGLAAASNNVTVILDAFGFDITLIETVGVGQVELDIIDACDSVIVAVVPESGDAVQTMKAGLMEIADIFVVNKADRPGSERLVNILRQTLSTRKVAREQWQIPVVATVATENKDIDKLHARIWDHIEFIKRVGHFESHRRKQIVKRILNILKNRFEREFLERLSVEVDFDAIVTDIYERRTNPFKISNELFEKFAR